MSEEDALRVALAKAYIRVRGAHYLVGEDEETEPCQWCQLAADQSIEALNRPEVRDALLVYCGFIDR